jgi:cytoskeletal protein CcmA (bactofilin family)
LNSQPKAVIDTITVFSMGLFTRNRARKTLCTALIGESARVEKDSLKFAQGIHIDGFVGVDVVGTGEKPCTVSVSEAGEVDGSIRANTAIIAGTVRGDIIATGLVHLLPTARVGGRIEYQSLEMEDGAIVQGATQKIL